MRGCGAGRHARPGAGAAPYLKRQRTPRVFPAGRGEERKEKGSAGRGGRARGSLVACDRSATGGTGTPIASLHSSKTATDSRAAGGAHDWRDDVPGPAMTLSTPHARVTRTWTQHRGDFPCECPLWRTPRSSPDARPPPRFLAAAHRPSVCRVSRARRGTHGGPKTELETRSAPAKRLCARCERASLRAVLPSIANEDITAPPASPAALGRPCPEERADSSPAPLRHMERSRVFRSRGRAASSASVRPSQPLAPNRRFAVARTSRARVPRATDAPAPRPRPTPPAPQSTPTVRGPTRFDPIGRQVGALVPTLPSSSCLISQPSGPSPPPPIVARRAVMDIILSAPKRYRGPPTVFSENFHTRCPSSRQPPSAPFTAASLSDMTSPDTT